MRLLFEKKNFTWQLLVKNCNTTCVYISGNLERICRLRTNQESWRGFFIIKKKEYIDPELGSWLLMSIIMNIKNNWICWGKRRHIKIKKKKKMNIKFHFLSYFIVKEKKFFSWFWFIFLAGLLWKTEYCIGNFVEKIYWKPFKWHLLQFTINFLKDNNFYEFKINNFLSAIIN